MLFMEESISIIVPAWNEERYVLKTSKFLSRVELPFKYSEIIFVAGGTDNTFKICNKIKLNNFNKVITLKQTAGDFKSGALIKGLKEAKGDYIALIDADVFVSPNLAIEISKSLKKYDSVCCDFIPMIRKGFWYNYYKLFKLIWAYNPYYLNSLIGGATISLKRDVLEEIGIESFFSGKTTAGVDYYMGLILKKHNKSIGFVKDTHVIIPRPNNIKDFIKDQRRWLTAFISLHEENKKFIMSNLILDFLHCFFPPLIILSNFKKLMKISIKKKSKIKSSIILFFTEYLIKFINIITIIRHLSKRQKYLGHFKGVDRYF